MISSRIPIVHSFPDFESITLLPSSDMHVDSMYFDERRWREFEKLFIPDNTFLIFAGDMLEMGLPRSKSSPFESRMHPREARDWWYEHLKPHKDKVLCLIDGNHDWRATKETSFFPLYDLACILGIEDRYRSEGAFVDIGVGRQTRGGRINKPHRYVARVNHKAQNLVNYGTADKFDGINIFISGHTHTPQDKPLAKLSYDMNHKTVSVKNIENIVCGSFLTYGGYSERGGLPVCSEKLWRIDLGGNKWYIETHGFYV